MLENLFRELKHDKNDFLNSKTGTEFEDRIKTCLRKNRFNELYQSDFKSLDEIESYKKIKQQIIDKRNEFVIKNELRGNQFKNCYIYQPYGSQNFPDFLIFTNNYIVALEIKYTKEKASHPMWNSNLPKANAIYIFGSYGAKDITFFLGKDILPQEERLLLLDFFANIDKEYINFKKKIKDMYNKKDILQEKGFMVYVRKAYTQDKTINKNAEINYFKFSNRKILEQNVLEYTSGLSKISE